MFSFFHKKNRKKNLGQVREMKQGQSEERECKTVLCLYRYCLEKDDDEERKARKRKEYEDDKKDSKCRYAHLVDYDTHKEYIWDGRKERILDLAPLDDTEKRLVRALIYLNSSAAERLKHGIVKQYDYAWIYNAIKNNLFLGSDKFIFKSVSDYVRYIKAIVNEYDLKTDIGDADNISLYLKKVNGTTLPWRFNGFCGRTEENRRNEIAKAFIFHMNPLMD